MAVLNPELADKIGGQMRIAYNQLVQQNKRFMSFDVERLPTGEFHEVGVTLIQNREIQSFNYRLKGVQRGPEFIFGKTIEADFDYIKCIVEMHANGAHLFIGHGILSDLKHFEEIGIDLPPKFRYDTGLWAKAMIGYTPRLYDLAEMYNIGRTQFHCSGNDARYTGEVFLKMVHTHVAN